MPKTRSSRSAPVPAASAAPNRYVCVHGHFYQPPRENPWLETVEMQDSAAPYHDWNDRITAECYAPNGASRIQNLENEIVRIVNNYGRMSFNFGPTLLSWLEEKQPRAYANILEADKNSARRYSGHGSALAQVYNHIIMPLASLRDARTQIRWGIADFRSRFDRMPEGMWLAETAVSRQVLDLLAQEGILFTVLAPNQCARVRRLVQEGYPPDWTGTPNDSVDTSQPYLVKLDGGRTISVFFYHGPNSRAIAFEGLLDSGEKFATRLMSTFRGNDGTPQLSHVATDGESYGHHHKQGEMALSFAMHWMELKGLATLTNYGEYLAKFPPTSEAEVVENSSWSCSHGVERWRSDCGCNGGKAGWNQRWRKPLRDALDFLRDATAPLAEQAAKDLLTDLWAARDAYIDVVLDRSPAAIRRFFRDQAVRDLTLEERTRVLELMELERHTQLMYTSCGWFFDEISGLETVQIIAYAGRVLQLACELFGAPGLTLEREFLRILSEAVPNQPELKTGADVYTRYVTGMRIGLEQVGAHYAISSVFRAYPEEGELFCFTVRRNSHEVFTSGRGKVALGRGHIRSRITEETEDICYAVLHLGDQNLSAAVRRYAPSDDLAFAAFSTEIGSAMRKANLPEVMRRIDRFFAPAKGRRVTDSPNTPALSTRKAILPDTGEGNAAPRVMEAPAHLSLNPTDPQPGQPETAPGAVEPGIAHTLAVPPATSKTADPAIPTVYSLNSLFTDEQHRILTSILNETMGEMEDSLRKIYEDHASLMHFLTETGMNPPAALALAAAFATNASLRRALEAEPFDPQEVARLIGRASTDRVTLDTPTLAFAAGQRMTSAMVRLEAAASESNPQLSDPAVLQALHSALAIADIIRFLPFEVDIWQAQNLWNDLLRRTDSNYWSDPWREDFTKLGRAMNMAVEELVVEEGVAF
jgi:alpha-amylase/alpha-mannosidase (GH57 family)